MGPLRDVETQAARKLMLEDDWTGPFSINETAGQVAVINNDTKLSGRGGSVDSVPVWVVLDAEGRVVAVLFGDARLELLLGLLADSD